MNCSRSICKSSWIYTISLILLLVVVQGIPSGARRLNGPHDPHDPHDDDGDSREDSLSLSTAIPALSDTIELALLSGLVYDFRPRHAQNCSSFPSIYNNFIQNENENQALFANYTYQCHMYERDDQDTEVLIVSRTSSSPSSIIAAPQDSRADEDCIVVIFAGTDDFRNALTDTDILTKHFGPESYDDDDIDTNRTYNFPPLSDNIRVHAGFNNAVFKHGLFDRIFDQVKDFKDQNPNARILTTGHSLGASDSVLTAVGLKIQSEFMDEDIQSINFGCPKTGSRNWRDFVNRIDGLGIWRVVNGLDLVPRLPGVRFHHVGHTVQLDSASAKAYWLHEGDKNLDYAGIPFGWNSKCRRTHLDSSFIAILFCWISITSS